MFYRTIQLNDVIRKLGKETAREVLSDFSCPKNKDVEYFAHKKAVDFELAGMTRTFLVYAQDQDNIYGLCALYSIAPKSLVVESSLSAAQKRKYFGTTYSVGNPINAILIGQLSKNYKDGLNEYIAGETLMSLIMECVTKIDILVPSVSVYIECEDHPKLKEYYETFGFKYFGKNKDNDLLQYLIPTRKFINPEYKREYSKKK